MSGVLVLNAGYEPLHRVSIRHAIRMLVREVAVIEESIEGQLIGEFPMPKVLRLVRYVVLKWRNTNPRWSRSRLLVRDNHVCGYCGKTATTIDHILPRSRGGATSWKNTVASCVKCNNRKDDRTPEEAGMRLKATPFEPTWWQVGAG